MALQALYGTWSHEAFRKRCRARQRYVSFRVYRRFLRSATKRPRLTFVDRAEMGISAEHLRKTFEDYNKVAKSGKDPFGKKFFQNAPFEMNDSFYVAVVCILDSAVGLSCGLVMSTRRFAPSCTTAWEAFRSRLRVSVSPLRARLFQVFSLLVK